MYLNNQKMKKKSSTLPDYQEALFTQQGGRSLESVASMCVRFTDGMYTFSPDDTLQNTF